MTTSHKRPEAGGERSRLFVYNGGFLTNRRVRRILDLAGYDVKLGLPGKGDSVGIWGNSPTAYRGLAVADRQNAPVVRIEDAFLRSVHLGRDGEPPLGLLIDHASVHFDGSCPSDLEQVLATAALDDAALLNRAKDAMTRIQERHLSKYNSFDPGLPAPAPGYVLVIDQTLGDAAVTASGADAARFREMLVFAQEEHPGARVIIKTHPETRAGFRQGYFSEADTNDKITLFDAPVSPWELMSGAVGVYTVSSQLGFEAILAGHKPRVFGQPFYAGWGLTVDEFPVPRRQRHLTRAQLFAAAMMLYPRWYNPHTDQLCEIEQVLDVLEARARAYREDRFGWSAHGMRLWKRKHLQKFYGREKRVVFDTPATDGRRDMVWASKDGPEGAVQVEDGFLRSRGLGAELVPPMSLITDPVGIYYDPRHPSALEAWIAQRESLRMDQRLRAERLQRSLVDAGISKYNLSGRELELPDGHRILVPGQVEDDASIQTGTGAICTNRALLAATREANPNAVLVYKPHPDVEAGLRPGAFDASDLADVVADQTAPEAILAQVQEVWTMTSLIGFEALLRGVEVTCLGVPFYAGWGLTTDLGNVPERRKVRPDLAGLVHATLIDYPRYLDPINGQACPAEVVVERLVTGRIPRPSPVNRLVSKLQGFFATHAHLWR